MQTTGNLGLKKPEGTDIVDIADLNGNMDILDNAVTGKVDKVTGKQLSTNDYTAAEKTKLAGVAAGATNYTHPATHPPAIIAQDASNRFVTDAEKTAWNAKAGAAVATTATNGLMSAADKTLLNNNTGFGTTAGTATAYTLTLSPVPTTLIAGLKFSFKTHIASGANPTLNPNALGAKAIKKPNGNAATLALNGVYTVVYDGTAFILQGEGGEYGTAVAADVIAGKTLGTENGLVTGAIVQRANDLTAVRYNPNSDGTVSAGISTGAYITDSGFGAGIASVKISDPNLIPANYLQGKPIFGVDGAIPTHSGDLALTINESRETLFLMNMPVTYWAGGRPYVVDGNFRSGNIRAGTSIFGQVGILQPKLYASGSWPESTYAPQVSGLGFTPRVIICWHDSLGIDFCTYYFAAKSTTTFFSNTKIVINLGDSGTYVNGDGFKLHAGNGVKYWEAWA
jgi:hypothetical protein